MISKLEILGPNVLLIIMIIPSCSFDDSCPRNYDCSLCQSTPVNIVTNEVQEVKLSYLKAQYDLSAQANIINTGVAIEIRPKQETQSYITGGPFCGDIYKFCKIRIYWTNSTNQIAEHAIDNMGTNIASETIYFNSQYNTCENALNYPNGLAFVSSLVTVGSINNEGFEYLAEAITKIQEPESSTDIELGPVIELHDAVEMDNNFAYYFYNGRYSDEGTGEGNTCSYCSLVIVPTINTTNITISQDQYDRSFGILKDATNGTLVYAVPIYEAQEDTVFSAMGKYNYIVNS